jgi:lysozyme family protein
MDGKMGPITLAGVGAFESKWGTKELIIRLMASRSKFLRGTNLWKEYGRGFAKRLYSVEQEALKLEAEG